MKIAHETKQGGLNYSKQVAAKSWAGIIRKIKGRQHFLLWTVSCRDWEIDTIVDYKPPHSYVFPCKGTKN